MSRGLYVRYSRSGFTPIEFLVGLAVIGMLVLAVYLYQQDRLQPSIDETSQMETTPETEQDALPTPVPVPTDSSDEEINQSADELNQLSEELNDLDTIEEDLSAPSADFESY